MKGDNTAMRKWALVFGCLATAGVQAGIAEIVGLTGTGEYRPEGESKWRAAQLKTALEPAWWVRTGAASTMALLVDPQTQVRLAANSIFQLKKEDKPDKGSGALLNLRQGRAWSQSKQATLRMETPSAIAAIHGTDWEMAVDADGNSTLTVLHGEVSFGNAHGTVTVGNGEQALAEPGKAPVKRVLANPADRVQWVGSFRVEPTRYPEYHAGQRQAIAGLIAQGDWQAAAQRLAALPDRQAADALLRADLAIREGDFAGVEQQLLAGERAYPDDARFAAARTHLALLQGRGTAALQTALAATARFPQSAAAWLALGDAARFEGRAAEARIAYEKAAVLDPADGRAELGLGRIAAARGDIGAARGHLAHAQGRTPGLPELAGEQGLLETAADRWSAAQAHFDAALAADPQDYVALAGLAQLRLHQGRDGAALDALLRASLLEPRYAHAYLDRAVAHHRRGEAAAALEFLRQASERDPHDPLPHFIASLVHQDRGELFAAAAEARQAKEKLPFLKSLDPLAVDQKGSANVGGALAKLGLTDWARHYAQESYDPLWAGSHFFLADQYAGNFNKSSELMQGFLTDPLAFGAGNRFQSLLPQPGAYLTLGARLTRSDDYRYAEPSFVANGMGHPGDVPVAWFVEGLRNDVRPGDLDLDARGDAWTLALGAKPRHDIALFAFANRYTPEIERMGTRYRERITGETQRLDLGGSLRPDADTELWLKAGTGSYAAQTQSLGSATRQDQDKDAGDVQLRFTRRFDRHALHAGLEVADADADTLTRGRVIVIPRHESDDFRLAYLQGRYAAASTWDIEGGLASVSYRKTVEESTGTTRYRRERALPALGAVWRPAVHLALRGAWQDWVRSAAPHSLRPPAIAGIPIDDQLTLPGGRQQRLRLQADWEASPTLFASAFVDEKRVRNLGEAGFVLNTAEEVSDPNRMRERGLFQNWGDPERLEAQPVFAEGRARQAGIVGNALLGKGFAGSASYVHTVSRNTSDWFRDMPLPYLPRHRVGFGLDWSNEARFTAGGWLVWRSERLAAENGNPLPASWDLTLRMKWESPDKRWQLEGWAANLLKRAAVTTLGVGVQLRF
jgi:tetratricopeptide (TPR) repeat protein